MTSLKRWHTVTTRPDVHCIRSRQPIPRESRYTPDDRIICCAAPRQPKNPRDYESIEALRDELMKSPWGGWSFAGLLNSLSESSMGKGKAGAWYKSLLMWSMQRSPELWLRDSKAAPQLALTAEQQSRVEQLAALLLCQPADVCRIIQKYPQMLEMEAGELVLRLVGLKQVLPGCDVASLVELQPNLFLEGERQQLEEQIGTCVAALRQGLPGADVDEMIEQDPTILLYDVEPGIAKLKELWDVDEQALSNSDPFELALAIRALSTAGPPKKF